MATGVAVPTKRDAHAQASAPTTHRELGWFYHMKTFGKLPMAWGLSSFSGGAEPSFEREDMVRELKAMVRARTLPLIADPVVKHAEGGTSATPAPPRPSASRTPQQQSKAPKKPSQQKPKASKSSGLFSRLRRFGRGKRP